MSNGALAPAQAARVARIILGQCSFFLFTGGALKAVCPGLLEASNIDAIASEITAFSIGGIKELTLAASA